MVLENNLKERFILVPNYELKSLSIKASPFSTAIISYQSSEWIKNVRTRYAPHLQTPTQPEIFYPGGISFVGTKMYSSQKIVWQGETLGIVQKGARDSLIFLTSVTFFVRII
jgi:hypothetical protein